MLTEIIGIWIGKLTKRSKYYFRFCSKKDERSLFHLGQIVIRQMCEFLDIGLRFKISAVSCFRLIKGLVLITDEKQYMNTAPYMVVDI